MLILNRTYVSAESAYLHNNAPSAHDPRKQPHEGRLKHESAPEGCWSNEGDADSRVHEVGSGSAGRFLSQTHTGQAVSDRRAVTAHRRRKPADLRLRSRTAHLPELIEESWQANARLLIIGRADLGRAIGNAPFECVHQPHGREGQRTGAASVRYASWP